MKLFEKMKLNFLINKNSLFFKNNDELNEKYYKLTKMKNVYIGNNCSELLYKLIIQIKQRNNTIKIFICRHILWAKS